MLLLSQWMLFTYALGNASFVDYIMDEGELEQDSSRKHHLCPATRTPFSSICSFHWLRPIQHVLLNWWYGSPRARPRLNQSVTDSTEQSTWTKSCLAISYNLHYNLQFNYINTWYSVQSSTLDWSPRILLLAVQENSYYYALEMVMLFIVYNSQVNNKYPLYCCNY